MVGVQVPHMNGGFETSYAKNSLLQRKEMAMTKGITEEAITEMYNTMTQNLPDSFCIADLGCSSGPNTLFFASELVKIVSQLSLRDGRSLPEFQILLNDLPGNDFNSVFQAFLPDFEPKWALDSARVSYLEFRGRFIPGFSPQTHCILFILHTVSCGCPRQAEGGILFVDEAYRLVPTTIANSRDYGLEALEEIMSFMDKEKFVVIFAGYTEPMDRVISSNAGMRRRISNIFHFDDFSCVQLAKILHLKVPNKDENSPFYGFKLDPRSTSVKEVAALIEKGTSTELRSKMNGGLVDQMLVKARENLDSRIDVECKDEDSMVAITSDDLAAGLKSLTDEEKRGNGNFQHMVRRIFHLTSDHKASEPADGPSS